MKASKRWRAALCALVLLAGAIYFAVGVLWVRSLDPNAAGSNDTYTYVYPTFLYALRSLRDGAGFFWNPYQDCGQPFFAISQTALLYPVNWVAAVLPREAALITTIIVNLCIAGVAAYRLGLEIGLCPSAALCTALAFELGGSAMDMAAWSPVHIAPYAWLMVAMWLTERLVHVPRFERAAALGGALALQLLPGFPQLVFFTYQLIALRVVWALAVEDTPRRGQLLAAAGLALALPLGLTAVQLVPALEVARESLRTIPLTDNELGGFNFSWSGLRALGSMDVFGLALAATALLGYRRVARSTIVFYALVAGLYLALTFGPGTPLFDLYARLPLGTAFRGSPRFLWMVGAAIALLTGCGMQTIIDFRGRGPLHAFVAVIPLVVGAAMLQWLTLDGIGALEWGLVLVLAVVAVIGAALRRPPLSSPPRAGETQRGALPVLLPVLVAFHGIFIAPKPFNGLRAGDLYTANTDAFRFVQERLTPQDRVLIVGRPGDYGLMPKSGMLFAVPDIFDYEPQVSRSYAEYFSYMRTGDRMHRLDDWYWIFGRLLPSSVQPRLLDVMATRYLIVAQQADRFPPQLKANLGLIAERGPVRIYENHSALPRALYVPRIVVKPAAEILPALVDGSIDPTRAAAVSDTPQSGFIGADPDATGTASIVENQPERVTVRVHASARGFLFLADQMFPGWHATVNGAERQILRANYTFRVLEVPAGDSEVVFSYHPRAVWIGALISLATVAALLLVFAWNARWRADLRVGHSASRGGAARGTGRSLSLHI